MNNWARMTGWHLALPPSRPCNLNLKILKTLVSTLPSIKSACILGSTPEYRLLLREKFPSVTIIDKSANFKSLSDSIVGSSPKESAIIGDWLDVLPMCRGHFDLVVSHFTHGNIAYDQRRLFFESVARSLATTGVFFDTVFQPTMPLISVNEILRRFSEEPNNLRTANDFNCLALFRSSDITSIGHVDTTVIYDNLRQQISNPWVYGICETTKLITPPGMVWAYSPEKTPRDLGYDELFTTLSTIPESPDSPFAGNMELRICRRRSREAR
jgi:hypothetical protein